MRDPARLGDLVPKIADFGLAKKLDEPGLTQSGAILGLEQVLQTALGRYPGAELLEAELEEKHGQYRYDIELLTVDGVARELDVDARDGHILRDKEDD